MPNSNMSIFLMVFVVKLGALVLATTALAVISPATFWFSIASPVALHKRFSEAFSMVTKSFKAALKGACAVPMFFNSDFDMTESKRKAEDEFCDGAPAVALGAATAPPAKKAKAQPPPLTNVVDLCDSD